MLNYEKLDAEILITMYNNESEDFNDELYSIEINKGEFYLLLKCLPLGFYVKNTNFFEFERISLCKYKIKSKQINLEELKSFNFTEIEKVIITCIVDFENNYLKSYLPENIKQKLIGEQV